MQHSPLPTRAEVTDVSNAILDGADACMLSGESAVGEYPVESVAMMRRISRAAEPLIRRRGPLHTAVHEETAADPAAGGLAQVLNPITEATVAAAGNLAETLDAKLVVVASASGATALSLAKNRCSVPVLGVSDSSATLRRMSLLGHHSPGRRPTNHPRALLDFVTAGAQNKGLGISRRSHRVRRRHRFGGGDRTIWWSFTKFPEDEKAINLPRHREGAGWICPGQ